MKIAIQGIQGAFHHIVATNYFGDTINLAECLTFDEMPKLLLDNKADALVMAIENSIAGAILPNYALLDDFNLQIEGEVYLPIKHQFMALSNQDIMQIKEVWSHPMAINQCRVFLRNYPHIKVVEKADTAEAAKTIFTQKLKGIAAIASTKAAEIYHLEILAKDIQTNPDNYTRFFILRKELVFQEKYNKISIKFITNHSKGSLAEVLNIFVKYNLNLSKIQSLPIINTPWKYSFFADLLVENTKDFDNALVAISMIVQEVKVLGKYTNTNN
jgi:prephenate dehydratase